MSNDSDFVLLGFIEAKDEVGSNINTDGVWRENFVGGDPVFSPNLTEKELNGHFSEDKLCCQECGQMFAFMAQMNCPVDEKPIDRVVYIFGCHNKECKSRKWKIFRVVTPSKDVDIADNLNGQNNANDGDHSESMDVDGGQDVGVAGGSLHSPFKEKVSKIKPMYLSVEEEKYLVSESEVNNKKDKSSKNAVIDKSSDIEKYENFLIPGTDEVANKFIKTVSKFNRQVIRYEWMGKPLLNQDKVKINPTKCSFCGSKRTFELQLMPGFISEVMKLVNNDVANNFELDFGTVIIFTCKNNCNQSSNVFVEEVLVLSDPDSEAMPTF